MLNRLFTFFLTSVFFICLSTFVAHLIPAHAASYTWDGGGSTNNWSDCDNWSTNVCPTSADTVTFNSTSTKNSTVDASFGGSVTSVNITSAYTGTITLARSLTTSTTFSQAGGTFDAAAQTLTISSSFSLTGGTFTASSTTMSVAGSFTISGSPIFNHNGGTVISAGAGTITCNNVSFNLFAFVNTGTRTVQSNCNLPLGNNPNLSNTITLNGTLSGAGTLTFTSATLTLNSGGSLSGFSGLVANALTINGVYNFGNYSTFDVNSTFTLNSGGVFTAPSGNATFATGFTLNAGSTFNANGGTVIFDGSTAVLACNNATFNLVAISHPSGIKTVSSDCNLPLGNNPIFTSNVTLNGTLSGTGTLNTDSIGGFILNSTGVLSGFSGLTTNAFTISGATADFSNYTLFDVNGNFALNSGSVFTAPTADASFGVGFTLNSGSTFNANGGTVIFDDAGGTISCNGTLFNRVIFDNTSTKTVSSDCSLPLGNNPTIGARVDLNGTISGSGLLTTNSSFNLNAAGATISGFSGLVVGNAFGISGATLDLSSYSPVDINGNFNLNSGTFTAPSGTMTIGLNFNHPGGVFNHNNGTIVMDGEVSTNVNNSTTFYNFTKIGSGNFTFEDGSTQTILGTLNLEGTDSNNRLLLRSLTSGSNWDIDPQGSSTVSLVDVQDANNISGTDIIACDSVDSGNNIGWSFNPASCPPASSSVVNAVNNVITTISSAISTWTCTEQPPASYPDLYEIDVTGTSAKLYFAPAKNPYDSYFVSFGENKENEGYGAQFSLSQSTGALSYDVYHLKPNTVYTFKVRAGNGCMPGPWSNNLTIKAGKKDSKLVTKYYPHKQAKY